MSYFEDKGDFLTKIENIEKNLLKEQNHYTDKIKSLLNDIFDLIDKYDYDKCNIDINFENNIFSQMILLYLIKNFENYKKNNNKYEEIIKIMENLKVDKLFKELVEIRENKLSTNNFKEEENKIIENIRKIKKNNNDRN